MNFSDQILPRQTGILGIPLDFNSSFKRGPASAPFLIREKFHSDSANYFSEDGTNLENHTSLVELGDLVLEDQVTAFETITAAVDSIVSQDGKVLSIGGDHSITYPIIRGFHKTYPDLTILHIDAHPDLYDELLDNKHSHACPFARIMEQGLANRLIQVGIRRANSHQREQMDRFNVECHEMQNWTPDSKLNLSGPLYISFDLDALDPAFAPGVSHHEPGGLSTRQVCDIIQSIDSEIVGADIVELNPTFDINGMTAMVAAKIAQELLAKMLH